MLITETVTIDGIEYTHNYSDAGYLIKQDGTDAIYEDAIDALDSANTYTETDVPAYDDEDALYAAAGRLMLGVE